MPRGSTAVAGPGWLRPQRLEYVPLDDELAVVRVVAGLARGVMPPTGATLVAGAPHTIVRAPVLGSVTHRPSRRSRTADHLLWRATFALPLELLECPQTLFALVAHEHMPARLPDATLASLEAMCRHWELGARGAGLLNGLAWRRAAALGTAVAVAGSSALPPAAAFASGGHGARQAHTAGPVPTVKAIASTDPVDRATASTGSTPAQVVRTQRLETKPRHIVVHHRRHRHRTGTGVSGVGAPAPDTTNSTPSGPQGAASPSQTAGVSVGATTVTHRHPHHHHRGASHSQTFGAGSGLPTISSTPPAGLIPSDGIADPQAGASEGHRHHRSVHHHHHQVDHRGRPSFSGGSGLPRLTPTPPAHLTRPRGSVPAQESETQPESSTGSSSGSSIPANSFWTTGMGSSSGEVALLSHLSGLFTKGLQPPAFLIPIYKKAGQRFHIPWEVLAAINSIETDYGRNLNVSSAGAVGWMQFMPSTWAQYGMSVNGKGTPNPYDPTDAIFSAARYLAANDGARHLRKSIFAYNHALWYVDSVMWRAGLITDHAQRIHHLDGYSLPLDGRYMHVFGRTDDGLDIEDAPDGAAVYSITPGVVTAVASDPTGFGPNYPVIRVTKGPLTGQYIYYGHVAASLVKVGQHVIAGQPIAVMGHTGDAASLGHGHIEIGFSDAFGDPLNHHGAVAWTPSGSAMRHVLVALAAGFHIKVR